MKVLLLVTLLAAITAVFAAEPSLHSKFHPKKQHGQPKAAVEESEVVSLDRRIVGGTEVGEGEACYHVTLHNTAVKELCIFTGIKTFGKCLKESMICGGFAITTNWMVSAGHCTTDLIEHLLNKDGFYVPYTITAHLADSKFSDSTYSNETTIPISEIVTHESYDQDTHQNDIALLKFKYPITPKISVCLACLPQNNRNLDSVQLWAYGHGATQEGGDFSDSLLKVDVSVVDNSECQKSYTDNITNDMICAGDMKEGRKGTCKGDTGGPLTYIHPVFNNKSAVVGITTSFGNDCARPGYPGVFTLVYSFIPWIIKNIGPNICLNYI